MTSLQQVSLGNTETRISEIGFGAMHLAQSDDCNDEHAIRILHHALELGITLIDTSDRYCHDESDAHVNERQIASALHSYSDDTSGICVATKGGMLRPGGMWVRFGKPDHIRQTIRESFEALGGDTPIPLWVYHQLDRNYSLEETLGAVREACEEGLIQHVGVSNFNVKELERARQVVEIASVQNEYSLICRAVERNGVLEYCEREGLTFFAWRPLGGKYRAKAMSQNITLETLAQEKEVSSQQLALAWLLNKSPRVVPIPGSTRLAGVAEAVAACAISLNEKQLLDLENAVKEEAPSLRLMPD